jgi:hypothetical protein
MQPRTLAVSLGKLGEGVVTITGATSFALQYGTPRKERFFAADASRLDAFLHGRAALHIWLEDGRTVRVQNFIRGA